MPVARSKSGGDDGFRELAAAYVSAHPSHFRSIRWFGDRLRDPRGGGRSSARETAARVAAGAIARKILGEGVQVRGALVQIGPHRINRDNWNWDIVEDNPFWCPDRQAAQGWEGYLDDVRKRGSSCGAVIEVVARRRENDATATAVTIDRRLQPHLALRARHRRVAVKSGPQIRRH